MGFCGAGWVVRNCYRPALEALGGRIIVGAVLEPDPAAQAAVLDLFPEAVVVSTRKALLAAAVEAIVVASPNHCHVDDAEAFLKGGLTCLVEKPVLRGCADWQRLKTAGRRGGAALVAGVACRHRADVRRWLEGTATIGPLQRLDLAWHRHRGVPATAWHLSKSPGWTGVFADLGSHLVDLAGAALGWRTDGLDIRFARQSRTGHAAPAAWYDGATPRASPNAAGVVDRFEAEWRVADCTVRLSVRWLDDTPGDLVRLDAIGEDGACRLDGLFGFSTERRTPHQRVTLWRSAGDHGFHARASASCRGFRGDARRISPSRRRRMAGGTGPHLRRPNRRRDRNGASMSAVLAIDLGGTFLRTALVGPNDEICRRISTIPTPPSAPDCAHVIADAWETARRPARLAVAAAPHCDAAGRVVRWPNRPAYEGDAILPPDLLRQVDIRILDDAAAAALAAHPMGTPDTTRETTVTIAIGTGIGGGAVVGGRLLTGRSGAAMAVGHIKVPAARGLVCACGEVGCLQAAASGRALRRMLGKTDADAFDIFALPASIRDPVLNRGAAALAEASATLTRLFDPHRLVIGGGLGLSPLFDLCAKRFTTSGEWPPPIRHPHGVDAALIGAARAFSQTLA